MKIGNYVEIVMHVPDFAEAVEFYEKLGFKKLDHDLYTDGGNNYRLVQDKKPRIALSYYDVNLGALQADGIEVYDDKEFTMPDKLPVMVQAKISDHKMPEGDVTSRTPVSRAGKFGEFSIAVDNFASALAAWAKVGFEALHKSTDPYPWGIISDGLIVIGLHQFGDMAPDSTKRDVNADIAYFQPDMADRIKTFREEGFSLRDNPPIVDGIEHALMDAPGGYTLLMFTGEI